MCIRIHLLRKIKIRLLASSGLEVGVVEKNSTYCPHLDEPEAANRCKIKLGMQKQFSNALRLGPKNSSRLDIVKSE